MNKEVQGSFLGGLVLAVNLYPLCAFVCLCVLSPCMVRSNLSELPHLELCMSNSDVLSKPGAIRNLSKFGSGYSGK